jgi:transcriptional regulator with XRE-family HTH domain
VPTTVPSVNSPRPISTEKALSFADVLRELRRRQHISQREIAHEVGLSFQEVCRIENGRERATPEQLRALAPYLDVPADLLLLASLGEQNS